MTSGFLEMFVSLTQFPRGNARFAPVPETITLRKMSGPRTLI